MKDLLDAKTIILAVAASLTGYVFYGNINLAADVSVIKTNQTQMQSEQRDLWGKYNDDLKEKVVFMKEYYEHKEAEQERWIEYWKEKAQNNNKE
jgi:hypothetical protein